MGMLARFLDFLFPRADTARIVAEAAPEAFGALLAPIVTHGGAIALLPYRHPLVRAAIIETKFHRNPKARALLGGVLADYLASVAEESAEFESIVPYVIPVPLGPIRRRERGYNQVEEVALCARARIASGILHRIRDTAPQTSLTRAARLSNMEDAFVASGVIDPAVSYIVLDDVMTTGATLASAAQALTGAQRVVMLALAH